MSFNFVHNWCYIHFTTDQHTLDSQSFLTPLAFNKKTLSYMSKRVYVWAHWIEDPIRYLTRPCAPVLKCRKVVFLKTPLPSSSHCILDWWRESCSDLVQVPRGWEVLGAGYAQASLFWRVCFEKFTVLAPVRCLSICVAGMQSWTRTSQWHPCQNLNHCRKMHYRIPTFQWRVTFACKLTGAITHKYIQPLTHTHVRARKIMLHVWKIHIYIMAAYF